MQSVGDVLQQDLMGSRRIECDVMAQCLQAASSHHHLLRFRFSKIIYFSLIFYFIHGLSGLH